MKVIAAKSMMITVVRIPITNPINCLDSGSLLLSETNNKSFITVWRPWYSEGYKEIRSRLLKICKDALLPIKKNYLQTLTLASSLLDVAWTSSLCRGPSVFWDGINVVDVVTFFILTSSSSVLFFQSETTITKSNYF